ncbi:MAG: flagellar biosynthesis protein FlhB [Hyphomicrobiaceae bacterium]|uniref:EscU/YscU/HrcU family type III secretion system export apparatus switch protein n=1 Tax=Pseudorhodoplanes sp. TaxID=1934341 RepID=UPI003D12DA7F
MSGGEDRESKTEEATPRRIEDALKKGNTPFTREVGNAATLLAFGLLLPVAAPMAAARLVPPLGLFIDKPFDFSLSSAGTTVALAWLIGPLVLAGVAPIVFAVMIAGIVASVSQNSPRVVLKRITPQVSRLSPGAGLTRVIGAQGRVEFLKALVKFIVVGVLFYVMLRVGSQRIANLLLMRFDEVPITLITETSRLFIIAGLCIGVLAVVDVLWTRLKWRIDLRMSVQEVKDEQKQADGDPTVKARQRSIARERSRQRMISAIPRATLVVANPTHYAVAMRYVHGETAAPVVIAKGVDHLALRIRSIAEANNIPVVEDKALARTLYAAVKTDRPIPPEFYRAVAEIIMHLLSREPRSTKLQAQVSLRA